MKNFSLFLLLGAVFTTASILPSFQPGDGTSKPKEESAAPKDRIDRSLRVMTYNIHHANPPSIPDSINISAIVETIEKQNPDIVALQEIDVNTGRSGKGNQAEIIAKKLKMNVFFGKAIDFDGGQYGVAILSKYQISEERIHLLPSAFGTHGEPRVLATVKVSLPDNTFIRFGSTHLDAQKKDFDRLLQIKEIVNLASQEKLPMIIAGDFNAPPDSEVINILDMNFTRTCSTCEPTIPVHDPEKAIDFIAYKPKKLFAIKEHRVIQTSASDHLPVLAVLNIIK
ncbi:endonuclease/exonuclease/phosphatase family protein [Salinimicrobium sp. MT39]|uniref:Endonuclease/exonuclease/phosphatase family protein n=1 Tax=Salinimicrobium profundisediminis TaxID=2994553 RepID=A0A9X3CY91_9FLAO|nr:endonuclease/exonuclease/phosphatase family protein [Salinimicrobium profundisediminis]MCX2839066.1 endonuclease/exonuclease/phosphatase family protein [Salinimicrobium profundisediminis]